LGLKKCKTGSRNARYTNPAVNRKNRGKMKFMIGDAAGACSDGDGSGKAFQRFTSISIA